MFGRLSTVQALRALAAISILSYHIRNVGVGLFGVDVFFVISGFIICYAADNRPDGFILHRVSRVVPLYWIATFLVFALAFLAPHWLQTGDQNISHLAKSLAFIPYLRPNGLAQPVLFLGWTLNYEMFFYVSFWLCLLIFGRSAPIGCAAVLIGIFAATHATHICLPWSFWGGWPILEFVGGIAAFLALRAYGDKLRAMPVRLLLLICALSIAGMSWQTRFFSHNYEVAICGPLAFVLVVAAMGLEGRVAVPAFVLAIGNASYSLYLLHPYVLRAIEKFYHPAVGLSFSAVIASTATIAGSILVSLASYRYFEAPSNNLLRRTDRA